MTTLYREIATLAADPTGSLHDQAYCLAVSDVLAILDKRGFTGQNDGPLTAHTEAMALIADMARKQEMDIDHYDEAARIYKVVTPVDPDLIEAREYLGQGYDRNGPSIMGKVARSGGYDADGDMAAVLRAIKGTRALASGATA